MLQKLLQSGSYTSAADIEAFMAENWALDTTKTVKEALAEDRSYRREHEHQKIRSGERRERFVASYTHVGGKIGVLVDVETDVVNDEIKEMAKNVAMQIAAISPKYTSDSEVSAEDTSSMKRNPYCSG